jgi:hypothetical protein
MQARSAAAAPLLLRSLLRTAAIVAPGALAFATTSCDDVAAKRHSHTLGAVAADRASEVPTDIVFYPHVLFGGDDAYLVEGRWYRPATEGWRVFTSEPLELDLLRRTLDQTADP